MWEWSLRNRRLTLGALLGLALACRGAWWATEVAVIENEGVEYARLAQNWLAGNGYVGIFGGPHVLFPPLYPGLIGLLNLAVGDVEVAGRLVSLAAGLTLVAVLYLLSRHVFGDGVAVVVGVSTAVHPLLVAISVAVYSESLAICLVMLAAYLTIEVLDRWRPWRAAGAGAAVSFAYLTRPETIAFAVPMAVALALAARTGGLSWPTALRRGALPVVVAVLLGLPYAAQLSWRAGRLLWEGKSSINEVINARMHAGMSYPEAARGLGSSVDAADVLHQGPYLVSDQSVFLSRRVPHEGNSLAVVLRRGIVVVHAIVGASFLGAPVILALAAAGLIGRPWWRRNWWGGTLLLAFGLLQAAFLLALQFLWPRFLFPLLPFLIPWAAVAVERVGSGIAAVGRRGLTLRSSTPIATLASVAVAVILIVPLYARVAALGDLNQAGDWSVKEAGLWIRQQPRPDPHPLVVMGYGGAVPFYAGAVMSYLPYAEEARALRHIDVKHPDYIVIRSSETRQGPYFERWLQQGIPSPCASPAHEVTSREGTLTRVWRWTCGH